MVDVLCIGMYGRGGRFCSANWNIIMEWIKKNCDRIEIYSNVNSEEIDTSFGDDNVISKYVFEGMEKYSSYVFKCNEHTITTLKYWDYNIDGDSISYLYFYLEEEEKGSIEICDFENYVILKLSESERQDLLNMPFNLEENADICLQHNADIENIVEDEWRPLGV